MAEAFARAYGGGQVDAWSAGSRPRGAVDAGAIEAMAAKGLDLRRQRSKGLEAIPQIEWDVAVTMGCENGCPAIRAKRHLAWEIPDPAGQPPTRYAAVRDAVDEAVKTLVASITALIET